MKDSVQFHNCSKCGRGWETKVSLPFWTREQIIETQKWIDDHFGNHYCHRCTERHVLISLKENAGKKVNHRELNKHLKKKYGY